MLYLNKFNLKQNISYNFTQMLRKKLKFTENSTQIQDNTNSNSITNKSPIKNENNDVDDDLTSKHFDKPFWKQFYDIECLLNDEIKDIKLTSSKITHIYNPVEYTKDLHCAYLKKFLTGPKNVVFIGMNPGPNGMIQTGVPFGNIITVRDWMGLNGNIDKPPKLHPKRPVTGLACTIEEPSGTRLWGLLRDISTDLEIFSKQCYVHNFCPLAFFDSAGQNITPSELKGNDKKLIRDICLKYLEKKLELLSPKILIAIGSYVDECLKILQKKDNFKNGDIKFLKLAHPSPRSIGNNNWPEKGRKFFEENDLLKYLKNEV